jgi:Fuc2NAc and GlcNAc transferase
MHASGLFGIVALAFGASVLGTFLTRRFALQLRLLDAPNQRSSHSIPTPNGGGLGFVLASSLAALVLPIQGGELWIVLMLSLVLAGVGLVDDARHVSRRIRFAAQFLTIGGGLIAVGILPSAHPWIGLILLLGGVWWVNLFNFMDGIDGIAATQAIFMLLAAAALGGVEQPQIVSSAAWIWMIGIASALTAFLLFNWPPASIFMGDVGSTWLAYVVFFVAVISVRDGWLGVPAWLILGGVFIVDSTTTLFTRMARRVRWFEAHRSHAYQRLARRLNAHKPVTLLATAINLLWLAPCAWAAQAWPDSGWMLLAIAYVPLVMCVYALRAGRADDVHLD